jgi:hypothetical protein
MRRKNDVRANPTKRADEARLSTDMQVRGGYGVIGLDFFAIPVGGWTGTVEIFLWRRPHFAGT